VHTSGVTEFSTQYLRAGWFSYGFVPTGSKVSVAMYEVDVSVSCMSGLSIRTCVCVCVLRVLGCQVIADMIMPPQQPAAINSD